MKPRTAEKCILQNRHMTLTLTQILGCLSFIEKLENDSSVKFQLNAVSVFHQSICWNTVFGLRTLSLLSMVS